jgi:hypothetical protein
MVLTFYEDMPDKTASVCLTCPDVFAGVVVHWVSGAEDFNDALFGQVAFPDFSIRHLLKLQADKG